MKRPETTRIAVLAAGVVIATLACLAVGTLLERSLEANSFESDAPAEASGIHDDDRGVAPAEILQAGEPRP